MNHDAAAPAQTAGEAKGVTAPCEDACQEVFWTGLEERLLHRNKSEGVLPDLPIAWKDDVSGAERAEKIVAALRGRGASPELRRAPLEAVGED